MVIRVFRQQTTEAWNLWRQRTTDNRQPKPEPLTLDLRPLTLDSKLFEHSKIREQKL